MQFIELMVKTTFIVHGFDESNQEIVESPSETNFMRKIVAVDRIQSISEKYILVSGSSGRVMYWEYDCEFDEIKEKLQTSGMLINK